MKFLDLPLKELDSVTPYQAKVLAEKMAIKTLEDVIMYYPTRYEDRTRVYPMSSLAHLKHPVLLRGRVVKKQVGKKGGKSYLSAVITDGERRIKVFWFNKVGAIHSILQLHNEYLFFGLPVRQDRSFVMTHPEIKDVMLGKRATPGIISHYSLGEAVKKSGITQAWMRRLQREIISDHVSEEIEFLPEEIRKSYQLIPLHHALTEVHLPTSKETLAQARKRLKMDELIIFQLTRVAQAGLLGEKPQSHIFEKKNLAKTFCEEHMSFMLTSDQRKTLRDIYADMGGGYQMNRLVQGDVGSGKTIVAFIAGLLPLAEGAQVAFLAPTEVLAHQHYQTLKKYTEPLGLSIAVLTGGTPSKERKKILSDLSEGRLGMIIGTHALLEERVVFHKLGLAVIDEQHRFGVAQRERLWHKNKGGYPPHILVMTATTIPRTLSMTYYGDLDVSDILEKPKNRKPIITEHYDDRHRLRVFGKIKEQIDRGHQVYIVYPRITATHQESRYKDLMDGYESIARAFPDLHISILHGRMTPEEKRYEMERFSRGQTRIMVATTIIEVGIHVPNATMMVIENADNYGLAQLHQLRGRVGRDSAQSYCLLLTKRMCGEKAEKRIEAMKQTNSGLDIAGIDLTLRGPGDFFGDRQSGHLKFSLADPVKDHFLHVKAKKIAIKLWEKRKSYAGKKHRSVQDFISAIEEKSMKSIIS